MLSFCSAEHKTFFKQIYTLQSLCFSHKILKQNIQFGVWEKHFVHLNSFQHFISTKKTQKIKRKFGPIKLKFGTDT